MCPRYKYEASRIYHNKQPGNSFQDLHDIVQDTPPAVIASWASCKPCQVGLLVDVLVEGLSRSNTALDLLGTFGECLMITTCRWKF